MHRRRMRHSRASGCCSCSEAAYYVVVVVYTVGLKRCSRWLQVTTGHARMHRCAYVRVGKHAKTDTSTGAQAHTHTRRRTHAHKRQTGERARLLTEGSTPSVWEAQLPRIGCRARNMTTFSTNSKRASAYRFAQCRLAESKRRADAEGGNPSSAQLTRRTTERKRKRKPFGTEVPSKAAQAHSFGAQSNSP